MIDYEFSNVVLRPREKWMLFRMRFRRDVPKVFLGDQYERLRRAGMISAKSSGVRDSFGGFKPLDRHNLTDKYYRYCAYRRDRFFHGSVWPCIISAGVSLIVSLLRSRL